MFQSSTQNMGDLNEFLSVGGRTKIFSSFQLSNDQIQRIQISLLFFFLYIYVEQLFVILNYQNIFSTTSWLTFICVIAAIEKPGRQIKNTIQGEKRIALFWRNSQEWHSDHESCQQSPSVKQQSKSDAASF